MRDLYHRRGEDGRDTSVNGIASLREDSGAGFHRERASCRDHAIVDAYLRAQRLKCSGGLRFPCRRSGAQAGDRGDERYRSLHHVTLIRTECGMPTIDLEL